MSKCAVECGRRASFAWLPQVIVAAVVCQLLLGCADGLDLSTSRCEQRVSWEQLRRNYGDSVSHEFTVSYENETVHCVSPGKGRLVYILLFGDHVRVVDQPRFESELVAILKHPGQYGRVAKPTNPQSRVEAVLAEPEIRFAGGAPAAPAITSIADLSILPAWILTAPLRAVVTPIAIAKKNEKKAELRSHFDPLQVQISMPLESLYRLFGPPRTSRVLGNSLIELFGPDEGLTVGNSEKPYAWFTVLSSDGKVTGVFSNDFLQRRFIEGLPFAK